MYTKLLNFRLNSMKMMYTAVHFINICARTSNTDKTLHTALTLFVLVLMIKTLKGRDTKYCKNFK